MCSYVAKTLNVSLAEAYKFQKSYFREYGTSLKGLMENHKIDPFDYLDYVHEIDLSIIKKDEKLDAALTKLPGRKIVFTNAATPYAKKVLEKLAIAYHFEAIFDIVDANFIPKPEPKVYQQIVSKYNISCNTATMVEDILKNLGPAAEMGMTTVWVNTNKPWSKNSSEGILPDVVIEDLSSWLLGVANT